MAPPDFRKALYKGSPEITRPARYGPAISAVERYWRRSAISKLFPRPRTLSAEKLIAVLYAAHLGQLPTL